MSIQLEDAVHAQPGECLPAAKEPTRDPQGKEASRVFAYPRDFLGNQFVYLTISPRARGLSIGVNLNPDRRCNFDCIYCEVDRRQPLPDKIIDCEKASVELEGTLELVHKGALRDRGPYRAIPPELLELRHVALSGDGEPTTSPNFLKAIEMVVHIRARGIFPFFKIVLITNSSHLDRTEVQNGLNLLTNRDEIWAKLDAGTQEYMDLVNRTSIPLERILANILLTSQPRSVIIQSLFSKVNGTPPSLEQIEQYALRLRELKEAGANIPLVQIYSATRPTHGAPVQHLPLKAMASIADTVRRVAGLRVEIF